MNLYELILGAIIGLCAGAIVVGLTLFACSQWERWFPSNGGVLPNPPRVKPLQFFDVPDPFAPLFKHPPKESSGPYFDAAAPYTEMLRQMEDVKFEPALPPMLKRGVPQERAVVVPKDVWAELQAMPNDGSWSTRQLVRAIQRANKKKRGAP